MTECSCYFYKQPSYSRHRIRKQSLNSKLCKDTQWIAQQVATNVKQEHK